MSDDREPAPCATQLFETVDFDAPGRTGAWVPHPAFAGVRLRKLVGGAATGGGFSSHAVMVDPGCTLAPHRHPDQDEQHLVLRGSGRLTLDGQTRDYRAGDVAVMPRGHEHAVTAGQDGMLMLAVFSPAIG